MPLVLSGSSGLSGNVGTTTKDMLPAGTVLQVVQGTAGTPVTSNSTTYVPINLTASIVPFSASSQILVQVAFNSLTRLTSSWNETFAMFGLFDGNTVINETANCVRWAGSGDANGRIQSDIVMSKLITAGSLATKTFSVKGKVQVSGYMFTAHTNYAYQEDTTNPTLLIDNYGTITLTEIKA